MGRRGHIGRGAINCIETLLMHSNYNLLLSILVVYTHDRSHPKGKPVLGAPPKIHTYIAIYIATEKYTKYKDTNTQSKYNMLGCPIYKCYMHMYT